MSSCLTAVNDNCLTIKFYSIKELTSSTALGELAALPGLQLVRMNQQGKDCHQETVSHITDADNLEIIDNNVDTVSENHKPQK